MPAAGQAGVPAEKNSGGQPYFYDARSNDREQRDTLRVIAIDDIQVFATRAAAKTPVAYSDLDKKQISGMNYGQDIPYLLTLTPSVVATSDAGGGIGYTGIRIRGVDATRINVTSNGVPMNDAESHGMFWVNVPDIASSIEDMQIQRGVGTSTNGAGAFGGSINLRTESPSVKPGAEASFSYGSFNTQRATAKVNTGLIKGRWAFGARLSGIRSDGYIDRASTDLRSWFAQGGYYGDKTVVKLITFGGEERTYHAWSGISRQQLAENRRYNPSGEITAVVADDAGRPILDAEGRRQHEVVGFYDDQTDKYIQNHYQLVFNRKLTPRWILNATLHYTSGGGYYEEYKNGAWLTEYGLRNFLTPEPNRVDYVATDSAGRPLPSDGSGNYTVDRSNIVRRKNMENGFGGAVFSVHYTGEKLTATAGGAGNIYLGEHFGRVIWVKNYIGDLSPDHGYYRNRTDKRDFNFFARGNYELIPNLNIYADLQWRYIRHRIWGVNDKYDPSISDMQPLNVNKLYLFFNPKAGLFYTVNDRHDIYASFAAAHKEPTRNNFTDVLNGPSPSPEQLFDYEIGYRFRSRALSAGVNLYYMDYNNQLVLTGQTNDIGEPMSANVASSYRAGIELTAGIRLTDWLRWDLNATFSRNIIRDYTEYLDNWDTGSQISNHLGDVTISYSPSIIAGSFVSARFGGFGASLQSLYVGSQYVTNSMQGGIWDESTGDWALDPLKLDAYFVNNLRLDYTFRPGWIRELILGIAVNNIFNVEYCSNGWGYSAVYGDGQGGLIRHNEMGYFPQATINFLANLTLRF